MARFEFDSKTGANNNRKNGLTRRGVIEIWPLYGGLLSESERLCIDIHGPQGADRGGAVIDRATARKVGAALLEWAGPDEFDRAVTDRREYA